MRPHTPEVVTFENGRWETDKHLTCKTRKIHARTVIRKVFTRWKDEYQNESTDSNVNAPPQNAYNYNLSGRVS